MDKIEALSASLHPLKTTTMKTTAIAIIMFLATVSMHGQDIVGTWNGVLNIQGTTLRVDFNISSAEDGYTSTMDSPDQNAFGIPVTTTEFKDSELTITLTDLGIEYKGKLNKDNIVEGTFTQMGQAFEMNLTKKKE